MKKSILISFLLTTVVAAGSCPVENTPAVPDAGWEWISYSSGTPEWYCWDGIFRGTWYDLDDFYPGSSGWEVQDVELWFYHHSAYAWDQSQFYAEIWTGDQSGPSLLLDQQLVTAFHMSPTMVNYSEPIDPGNDFWVIVNTEFSAGGWPSSVSDGGEPGTPHSFSSGDFINWDPWMPGSDPCNFFISANVMWYSLNGLSWGALKTVF